MPLHWWDRKGKLPEKRIVDQSCPYCTSHKAELLGSEGLYKHFRCEKCGKSFRIGKK